MRERVNAVLAFLFANCDLRGQASRQAFVVATAIPIVFYALACFVATLATGARPWPLIEAASNAVILWPLLICFWGSLAINCAYFVRRSRSIGKSPYWALPFGAMWFMADQSVLFAITATGWSMAWANVYVAGDRSFKL